MPNLSVLLILNTFALAHKMPPNNILLADELNQHKYYEQNKKKDYFGWFLKQFFS